MGLSGHGKVTLVLFHCHRSSPTSEILDGRSIRCFDDLRRSMAPISAVFQDFGLFAKACSTKYASAGFTWRKPGCSANWAYTESPRWALKGYRSPYRSFPAAASVIGLAALAAATRDHSHGPGPSSALRPLIRAGPYGDS